MSKEREELERLWFRIDIVLAHLDGKTVSEIAREIDTSRPTVRKWIARYEAEGVAGLVSRTPSGGRPREIGDDVREALVRLPRETRPPEDLGDQWTAEMLARVFGVSSSFVSQVWKEARFNPPRHPQQALRNQIRMVVLHADLIVPDWFALELQTVARERNMTLDELLLDPITRGEPWSELQDEMRWYVEDEDGHVVGTLFDKLEERWKAQLKRLPREDPRPEEEQSPLDRLFGPKDPNEEDDW